MDLFAAVILGSVSGVIKKGDDLLITLLDKARVMLEAKLDVGTQLKVRAETTQPPDDLTGGTIDLVNCASIPRGNQVITLGILVHGVDMEVVPCVG